MGKTRGDRKARFTTRAGCIRLGSLVSLSKFSDNFSDKHILRQTRFDVSPYLPKYTREDSNLQPPVPKTGETTPQPVKRHHVVTTPSEVFPSVCPRTPKTDHEPVDSPPSGDGFAAAVAAVMALPLSDDEKAEAVRRLLR
jgi:hypothetical protein